MWSSWRPQCMTSSGGALLGGTIWAAVTHWGDLAHLDLVAVENGQDTVHPGEVAAVDEPPPAVEVLLVRLRRDLVAEAVQVPRAAFGAGELGCARASHDLEPKSQARQQFGRAGRR